MPDELIIKRKNLHALEFIQFILGGCLAGYSFYVLAFEQGANYFLYISTLLLGVGFLSAALLLAMDNHLYRAISAVSFVALFALVFLLAKVRIVIGFAGLFTLWIMYLLYIYPPNKEYHAWTKSLTE